MICHSLSEGTSVVWEAASGVVGRLVTSQGIIGPLINIGNAGTNTSPDVVSDGLDFLVVWHDGTNYSTNYFDISGQRVSSSGSLIGGKFRISPAAQDQSYASVGFDGTNYFVVWTNNVSPNANFRDIYGARVSVSGWVLDPNGIAISTAPNSQYLDWMRGDVSFNGANYLVVWEDYRSGSRVDIYGARVSAAGQLLDGPPETGGIAISTNAGYCGPHGVRAVFDHVHTHWLVVWAGCRTTGARVSASGTVLDPNGVYLSKAYIGTQWSPSLAFDGTNYLVTWHKAETTGTTIYGQLVSTFSQLCTDNDNDGYAIEGGICGAVDCNDSNSAIYPGAPDIICNGIDNNCNGIADDGYVPSNTICGSGVCLAIGQLLCLNAQTQDTCTPGQPTGVDDNCNGIDENCSGVADDGYVPSSTTCGVGVCGTTGQLVCLSGQTQDTCTAGQPTGADDNCNSIDEDCSGVADDGYVPSNTTCGVGVCGTTGQLVCVAGQTQDTCTPGQPTGADDNCNSIDEDCSGVADDGYVSTSTSCGEGVCGATGQLICVSGQTQNTCTPGSPTGGDDNCNGIDEDCSGVADDSYVPTVTSCGLGVCGATGQLICVTGQTQDTCTAGLPLGNDDNCNGIDDDCNGVNDDGYTAPSTSCGVGICGASGQLICVAGQTQDTCTTGQPTGADDNCNGIDEDCSGIADDGYVPTSTSCGVGVCGATGELVCVAGLTQDTCTAGLPQTEGPVGDPSCNDTMDNDCDGNIDLTDSACINTPSGQNVTTEPVDETTGTTPVSVNFSYVSTDGATTLSTSEFGPPPPAGFRLGTPFTYYEISTTAIYSGQIEICIDYSGISYANESTLKLFHHKDNIWVDITTYLDTDNNIICGVTSSLSPFAIFELINQPPVAEAGADLSLACLEMTCPVILDGSGSTDPNSTPGNQDDIASYEWYKDYRAEGEVLLAPGRTISYDLPLGEHKITLVVTDRAGVQEDDEILVRVNPAQLSLLEITKAEVEWEKAGEKPNRVKIHGKVAMPAGKDYYQVNAAGNVTLGISSASNALNQNMVFQVKGDYGSKWEYKADPTGIGISKYEIDWQGAKFDYNRDIRLKSNHLGSNSTTLEIDRKDIAEAIVISVNDITIHIDSTGAVSAVPESFKVDVDDDGEIEVELPLALAMNTAFSVTHGTTSYTVKVGDYYSAAVGKFELMGRFDPNGLNGSIRPATLDLGITFGNQGFPGMFHILDGDWAQLKNVEWKYKK